MRIRGSHLVILAAAAFVLADLTLIWIGLGGDWAFDFTCCYQQAADRALNAPATLYDWSDTYTFRYTPIGALVFAPLVPLEASVAPWAWLIIKLGVLAVVAFWFSRAWEADRRWLIVLLVFAFPPIVHDLVIGNVSTLTVLAFLAVARWQDARGGIALGLLTVLMPKPHLLGVLAYLAIRRPRDFAASLATMAVGALVGLAVFGVEPWIAFVETLREPLERTFTANVAFSAILGPAGVAVGIGVGLAVVVTGVLVGGTRGFGMSIIGGILAGPYSFIHYLSGTLVAVEPTLRARPRWLVPFPWLLVVFPLIPLWLTGLAGVLRATPADPAAATEPPAAERG